MRRALLRARSGLDNVKVSEGSPYRRLVPPTRYVVIVSSHLLFVSGSLVPQFRIVVDARLGLGRDSSGSAQALMLKEKTVLDRVLAVKEDGQSFPPPKRASRFLHRLYVKVWLTCPSRVACLRERLPLHDPVARLH
jgi:hypothetical protein